MTTVNPPTLDQPPTEELEPTVRPGVRWRALALFLVLAYGLAWIVAIPLWRNGGLANPLFLVYGIAMMATPAVAALVSTFLVLRPRHPARFLGLVPLRPIKRLLPYAVVGFVGPWLLCGVALLIGALAGVAPLTTNGRTVVLLAAIPIGSLLTAVAALGEELGWRGFLLPLLRPFGTVPALLVSGLVWGPWHAPVLLLGYNYGLRSGWSIPLMTVTTVLMGILFGWLRMRSGSVWPSTLAHGSLNASSGALLLAFLPAAQGDVTATVLGWAGWLAMAAVIAGLIALRTFRWAPSVVSPRRAD